MALEYGEAFKGLTEKEKMYTYYMFKAVAAGWRVVLSFWCYGVDHGCASLQGSSLSDFTVSSHFQKGDRRSIENPLVGVRNRNVCYFCLISS